MHLPPGLPAALAAKARRVGELIVEGAPVLVAYSGGVDSSCLLALAVRAAGERAHGAIADSPSLPRAALDAALRQARAIGARVEILRTREFDDERYAANPPDRCFFCKSELFSQMEALAAGGKFASLAYGENADDPPAQRPGSRAAAAFSVRAPLREAGLGKLEVRALARAMGLASAEAPAQPCLSSRLLTGVRATASAVGLVERGEASLAALGFRVLRVRLLSEEPARARVQVAPEELPRLARLEGEVKAVLREAGFSEVELDPIGYRGAGLR